MRWSVREITYNQGVQTLDSLVASLGCTTILWFLVWILVCLLKLGQERLISLKCLLSALNDRVNHFVGRVEVFEDFRINFDLCHIEVFLTGTFIFQSVWAQDLIESRPRTFQYLGKVIFKLICRAIQFFELMLWFYDLCWADKVLLIVFLITDFLLELLIKATEIVLNSLKHLVVFKEQIFKLIVLINKVKSLLLLLS